MRAASCSARVQTGELRLQCIFAQTEQIPGQSIRDLKGGQKWSQRAVSSLASFQQKLTSKPFVLVMSHQADTHLIFAHFPADFKLNLLMDCDYRVTLSLRKHAIPSSWRITGGVSQ